MSTIVFESLRGRGCVFSVNSIHPHEADTVAFSNLSTLESVFKGLRFHIVFVWTGPEAWPLACDYLASKSKSSHCQFSQHIYWQLFLWNDLKWLCKYSTHIGDTWALCVLNYSLNTASRYNRSSSYRHWDFLKCLARRPVQCDVWTVGFWIASIFVLHVRVLSSINCW